MNLLAAMLGLGGAVLYGIVESQLLCAVCHWHLWRSLPSTLVVSAQRALCGNTFIATMCESKIYRVDSVSPPLSPQWSEVLGKQVRRGERTNAILGSWMESIAEVPLIQHDPELRRCGCSVCGIIRECLPLHSWRCCVHRISFRNCPYCGSSEVYGSHRKTWGDLTALFFLLGPVRCHGCMRRHFRPLFLPARNYITAIVKPITVREDEDDKRKRTA
jgi:hypothetical protein